jgi:hypothetical protein
MDYLLVQATSVLCKCIFSSAKETDTTKQNRISPALMEALQLLKFSLKKECLSFTNGWPTSESAIGGELKSSHNFLHDLIGGNPDAMDDILNKGDKYNYN